MHKESFQRASAKHEDSRFLTGDRDPAIRLNRLREFIGEGFDSVVCTGRRSLAAVLILSLIPVAFLVLELQLTKATGPQWTNYNFENSYPYLFNSLLILKGRPPAHIDHPGTTTQVFGALCLRLFQRGSNEKIIDRALKDPEKAIRTIHRLMLFVVALSMYGCSLWTCVATKSLMSGFLVQLPVLFFQIICRYSIWYGSDLFVIFFAVIALAALCILIKQRLTDRPSVAVVLILALACGLGIATKLTFFPIAILGFFLCCGLKHRMIFCAGVAFSTAIALLPIYSELHYIFAWVVALATHTGLYGTGSVGFIDQHQFSADVSVLIRSEPILPFLVLGSIIAGVFLYCRSHFTGSNLSKRDFFWIAAALPIGQALGFVLIAKHANVHYLIPLLLTVGLNLYFLWFVLLAARTLTELTIYRLGFYLLLIVCCFFTLRRQLDLFPELKGNQIADTTAYREASTLAKNVPLVGYYRSSSPQFAEYFADGFAAHVFCVQLERKYPGAMFYNIFADQFETWTKFTQPKEFFAAHAEFLAFGNSSIDLLQPRTVMTGNGRYALSLMWSKGGNRIYKVFRKSE